MNNNGFTIIDNNILRDNNLNIYEKYFLMALKSFDHRGIGEVYPTYNTLMKLFGTTKRNTISNIIKSLKDKNYIVVMKKDRANCYKFIKDYLINKIETDKRTNNSNPKDISTSISKDTTNSNLEDTNVKESVRSSNLKDTTSNNLMDTSNSNQRDTSTKESLKSSNPRDTTTSNLKDTSNSIQVDTLKIKEKNTKEIYINIFNAWNNTNISNEECLNSKILNSITMALRRHTSEKILTAIKNYKEVYYSDFYYDYTWSLQNFLTKQNAISKFTEDGGIYTSYKYNKQRLNKEEFNLADLID